MSLSCRSLQESGVFKHPHSSGSVLGHGECLLLRHRGQLRRSWLVFFGLCYIPVVPQSEWTNEHTAR